MDFGFCILVRKKTLGNFIEIYSLRQVPVLFRDYKIQSNSPTAQQEYRQVIFSFARFLSRQVMKSYVKIRFLTVATYISGTPRCGFGNDGVGRGARKQGLR